MNEDQNRSEDSFKALRAIEAELFERAPANAARPAAPSGPDTWRLNREVLDLNRKCAELREELEAARTLLAEQNVLAASSLSALRETGRDLERAREELRLKEEEKRALGAELDLERNRRDALRRQLAMETAHRAELTDLLRGAVGRESPAQPERAVPPPPAPEPPAPVRPGRFVRRFF